MTLGINTAMNDGEGGQFLPIVKYMAEAGRFFKIDRMGGANGFESVPTELPPGTKFLVDFGSTEVGWMYFVAGQPPSFAMVPLGQRLPAQPSPDHRQGFRLKVHLGRQGGVREFATATKTVTAAVDDLHTQFEAAAEARAGKLPVVAFTGTTMITNKNSYGTKSTFRPVFDIVGWADRPADLGERTVPPPSHAGSAVRRDNGGTALHQAPPQGPVDQWASTSAAPPDLDDEIPF